MLKVSCILTSYNRPIGVVEAIASVQAQTYPNWELIIVDDNSDLETQEVLKDIVSKDHRCKLIQSGVKDEDRYKTARYATCINMAIPHITGDLVTYLTDDDIFYPRRFEKMVEVFKRHRNIHVVYGRQKVVVLNHGVATGNYIRPLIGITRSPGGHVDHNSFMHRRSCLDIVKGWDDNPSLWTHGDIGFFNRLVQYWDFYPLDFITDEHRIHENGIGEKMNRGEKPWEQKDTEFRLALPVELSKLVREIIDSPIGLTGWLDAAVVEGSHITMSGWARNPITGEPAKEIIIVNQEKKVVAHTAVTLPRNDVADYFHDQRLLQSGWLATINKNMLSPGNPTLSVYLFLRNEKKAIRLAGEKTIEFTPALHTQIEKFVETFIDIPADSSGWIDGALMEGSHITMSGWARNPITGEPAKEVIIVNQEKKIFAHTTVTHLRNDVASFFHDERMLQSGWSVTFEKSLLPKGNHTFFAYQYFRSEKKAIRTYGELNLMI